MLPAWDNEGEPGNQVPTKSLNSGEPFLGVTLFHKICRNMKALVQKRIKETISFHIMDIVGELSPFRIFLKLCDSRIPRK